MRVNPFFKKLLHIKYIFTSVILIYQMALKLNALNNIQMCLSFTDTLITWFNI